MPKRPVTEDIPLMEGLFHGHRKAMTLPNGIALQLKRPGCSSHHPIVFLQRRLDLFLETLKLVQASSPDTESSTPGPGSTTEERPRPRQKDSWEDDMYLAGDEWESASS